MKRNIAVIGCGHWGKNLVRNFNELESLYAVCDPNEELSTSFANQYKVKNLSFDEVLTDHNIQGVVLAVPVPLHCKMALKAIKSGKHVYVEKPLAMNKSEAFQMIEESKEHNVALMVGHLLQYHPVFIEFKEIIRSNKLGLLKYIYSNRLSCGKIRSEEDVIWSFAPHDASMILSLTQEEPESIQVKTANILQDNIADIATLHLNFPSGIKGHISVSWIHPYKEQKLVAICDQGMLVFDDTKQWPEKLALFEHLVSFEDDSFNILKAEPSYISVEEAEPLKRECEHFLNVVAGKINPLTDGLEGLKVLNVLTEATLLID